MNLLFRNQEMSVPGHARGYDNACRWHAVKCMEVCQHVAIYFRCTLLIRLYGLGVQMQRRLQSMTTGQPTCLLMLAFVMYVEDEEIEDEDEEVAERKRQQQEEARRDKLLKKVGEA